MATVHPMKRRARYILLAAALLLVVYAGSYFICLDDPISLIQNGVQRFYSSYRYYPESANWVDAMYYPMHQVDRSLLRPHKWERRVQVIRDSTGEVRISPDEESKN